MITPEQANEMSAYDLAVMMRDLRETERVIESHFFNTYGKTFDEFMDGMRQLLAPVGS